MSESGSADPFSVFLNTTSGHVSNIGINIGNMRDRELAELVSIEWAALSALRNRRAVGTSELGETAEASKVSLARALSHLEERGLIRIIPDESDPVVMLTGAGRDLLDRRAAEEGNG